MIDKNIIINAVSPLKAKSNPKSYKGGTKVKKAATATAKRAGGFEKSTGTTNKAGYNAQTKFKAIRGESAGGKPAASVPSPQKPYKYGPDGKLGPVTNNYINTDNSVTDDHSTVNTSNVNGGGTPDTWEETTKVKELESYDDFWETRIKSKKHSKGMQKYIDKHNGDLDAARKEWEIVSRANESKRNKNRETTTTTKKTSGKGSNVNLIMSGSTDRGSTSSNKQQ